MCLLKLLLNYLSKEEGPVLVDFDTSKPHLPHPTSHKVFLHFFIRRFSWHTKLAPAVLVAVRTEFSYVIILFRNIGYIVIWIT